MENNSEEIFLEIENTEEENANAFETTIKETKNCIVRFFELEDLFKGLEGQERAEAMRRYYSYKNVYLVKKNEGQSKAFAVYHTMNGESGLLDKNGRPLLNELVDHIDSQNLYALKDGLVGLLDMEGEWIIPTMYDIIYNKDFSTKPGTHGTYGKRVRDEYYRCLRDGKVCMRDEKGVIISSLADGDDSYSKWIGGKQYFVFYTIEDTKFGATYNNFQLLNTEGKAILPGKYKEIYFSDKYKDMVIFSRDGEKHGVLNLATGKTIVDGQNEFVEHYSHFHARDSGFYQNILVVGKRRYRHNNEYKVINLSGEVLAPYTDSPFGWRRMYGVPGENFLSSGYDTLKVMHLESGTLLPHTYEKEHGYIDTSAGRFFLLYLKNSKRVGIYRGDGTCVTDNEFELVRGFYNTRGGHEVRVPGKSELGVLDITTGVRIPCEFKWINALKANTLELYIGYKQCANMTVILDAEGKTVFELKGEQAVLDPERVSSRAIGHLKEINAYLATDGNYYLLGDVRRKGYKISLKGYASVEKWKKCFKVTTHEGLVGIINENLKVLLEPEHENIQFLEEDIIQVSKNDQVQLFQIVDEEKLVSYLPGMLS